MIRPIKEILLSLDKTLQDEIVTEGGLKLYMAADYNFEWNATVTGKVAAMPISSTTIDIKEGDEVAFGYDVIADRDFASDAHRFRPLTEGNPNKKHFYNGNGESIMIAAIPFAISTKWSGVYLDKNGDLVDGCFGSESDVERWQSQFTFSSVEQFAFKNILEYEGRDYWRCDTDNIFAKKTKNGIQPVGDRIILKPIVVNLKTKMEIMDGGKPLPYQKVTFTPSDRGVMTHDCEELNLKEGDIVGFPTEYVEKYNIWGNDYFLLKHKRAICTWQIEK